MIIPVDDRHFKQIVAIAAPEFGQWFDEDYCQKTIDLDGVYLVDTVGDIVRGVIFARNFRIMYWIGILVVHPRYRRNGIAAGLVERVIARARTEPQCRDVYVDISANVQFYESVGFARVSGLTYRLSINGQVNKSQ